MKFSKNLFFVLILASIGPALYFRIQEWVAGDIPNLNYFFKSLLVNSLISLVVTLLIAWVILSILHWLNQKFPWNENALKRLVFEILSTFPVALLLGYSLGRLAYPINNYSTLNQKEFIFSFLAISAIMNLILVAISDWFYFFERWKSSLIEKQLAITDKEILRKEKAIAQYEALKNQINPHFLFNSLNVLSSLIHKDVDKAEEFIDEFSALYRYILENDQKSVVPLEDEISIVKSYANLQKIRFEDSVEFNFNLPEHFQTKFFVFPLSIQTLIENSIKHNTASPASPLVIEISKRKQQIDVKNNLQLRQYQGKSTGIGTKNLILRYRPYQLVPRFIKTELNYTASLPLLTEQNLSLDP